MRPAKAVIIIGCLSLFLFFVAAIISSRSYATHAGKDLAESFPIPLKYIGTNLAAIPDPKCLVWVAQFEFTDIVTDFPLRVHVSLFGNIIRTEFSNDLLVSKAEIEKTEQEAGGSRDDLITLTLRDQSFYDHQEARYLTT